MDLSNIPQYLQVVLGIGLVIFVHESGHYLAARWCKVRVHVFSLGFGPRLFAWKRGDTTYQIAAVPLGGYVRMAGDESIGGSAGDPQPWELGAKSVPQRFLIYSGGVLMNVLFGIIVFPILFLAGIPSIEPVIGSIEPGSPAWHAGLEPGSRVLSVNDREIYDLMQVPGEVAYGGRDGVELVVLPPGQETARVMHLQPVYDEFGGIYSIGRIDRAAAENSPLVVVAGGSAASAGLLDGDLLLGVEGITQEFTPARQLQEALRSEEPLRLRVRRGNEQLTIEVEPREASSGAKNLMGVTPLFNLLASVRESELSSATGLAEEDRIQTIAGRHIHRAGDVLPALLASEGPVEWRVLRDGREVVLTSPALSEAQAVALHADLAIEADMEDTRVSILPRSAAARAGFRSGDRIEKIDGSAVQQYEDIRSNAVRAGEQARPMLVDFSRREQDGKLALLQLSVQPGPYTPLDYGMGVQVARYDYRVTNGMRAISLGVGSCFDMMRDVGRTLSGVLTQEVRKDNLGGIITIGVIANHTAEIGLVKFFWFLCLLSINLAILNVLPIPLLDGGHLFFLMVEGIKGSPVSERILSYSQLVGLVLIVSIFVFVIYNDLSVHVFN